MKMINDTAMAITGTGSYNTLPNGKVVMDLNLELGDQEGEKFMSTGIMKTKHDTAKNVVENFYETTITLNPPDKEN